MSEYIFLHFRLCCSFCLLAVPIKTLYLLVLFSMGYSLTIDIYQYLQNRIVCKIHMYRCGFIKFSLFLSTFIFGYTLSVNFQFILYNCFLLSLSQYHLQMWLLHYSLVVVGYKCIAGIELDPVHFLAVLWLCVLSVESFYLFLKNFYKLFWKV